MVDKVFTVLGGLPRYLKFLILLLIDYVMLSLAYGLSTYLTMSFRQLLEFDLNFWHYLTVVVLGLLVLRYLGFYHSATRFMSLRSLITVSIVAVISALFFYGLSNVFNLKSYGAAPAVMYGLMVYILLGGSRLIVRAYYAMRFNRMKTRVVIYGAGAAGRQLAQATFNGPEYLAVAFVDDDPELQGIVVEGLKVYPPEELGRIITKYNVGKVLLALPSASINSRKKILVQIQEFDIPVLTIPGLKDVVEGKMQIDEFQDVSIEDLLGRDPIPPNQELLNKNIAGKVVMVTGAGGSIGSELCRQILLLEPKQLLLFEVSEFALYSIDQELKVIASQHGLNVPVCQILGSIQDREKLDAVLKAFNVDTIYHAAAYKHVPLVEFNVSEGVKNNIVGTMNTAQAAIEAGVEKFVLISTDKAVRPTNVMGASKRFAELVLQGLAEEQTNTCFTMVRFGNVLGSSGSVIPYFEKQIRNGGPVTVTHKDITRFFMTIPEAAQLVIQAGAMGKGGDVFVLDMGEPVKIVDLAENLIKLMGMHVKNDENPEGDIEIVFTGLRPGEKLYEELLIGEDVGETQHPRIMTANEKYLPWNEVERLVQELVGSSEQGGQNRIREILLKAPTDYKPSSPIVDHLWNSVEKEESLSLNEAKKAI